MKKWLGISLFIGLFFLTGCTKLPQEEFTEALTNQQKVNAGEFQLSVDTFELADKDSQNSEEGMIAGMIFSQLAGTKIDGEFVEDSKSKNIRLDSTLTSGEMTVPFNLLVDGKTQEMYLSAEIFETMMNLFAFNDPTTDSQDASEYQDKYIQINPEELGEENTDSLMSGKSIFTSDTFAEYVKTLDRDSFKKEKDTITHTFTKKELEGFLEYAEKQKADQEAIAQLEEMLKDTKSLDLTVTVNTKKQEQKIGLKMVQAGELPMSIGLTFTISGKQSDEEVSLPAAENVIDQDELFNMDETSLWDDSTSYYGEDALSDEDWADYTLTDEEFEELLGTIKSELQGLTEEEISEFLEIYQDFLTDEQYQRLVETLQVGQTL
jgi:hypothetical protein